MRVVIDTNVLLSAIAFGGKPRQVLGLAISGHIDVVGSVALLDELEDRLLDPKFGYSREAAIFTREAYAGLATVVQPASIGRTVRDLDDDVVVATAIAGEADLIVTGDKDLLELEATHGIEIVRPADFLDRVGPG